MSDINGLEGLFARLDDLCAAAERGELVLSSFLSPRELHYAKGYLDRRGAHYLVFGGYAEAERTRIHFLPDYMEGVSDARELAEYGYGSTVAALEIKGSGYRRLTHRDYLGSLLGLGVERDVVGDVLVFGESGEWAVVFCDGGIKEFFLSHLEKIANDKVKVAELDLERIELPQRSFAAINDTVASARFDCIVAALCSLSRERAKEVITAGLAELDYEAEERPDRTVNAPCTVSVRGQGKFRVLSVTDKTRKGRYRLVAEKFL